MSHPSEPSMERFMRQALALASQARMLDEVPIGAVVVHEPTAAIIGRAFNRRQVDRDPTAHAEILALRQAGAALGDWRLSECDLYVTLEPCVMCAGALVNARIRRLVYGCDDPKAGAVKSLFQIGHDQRLNHRLEIVGGVLGESCAQLLTSFFQAQRALGKK